MIDTLSFSIPIPAVQGKFGARLVTYTTQIPANQIPDILRHDPRSANWKRLAPELRAVYEKIQRPTKKDRREGVSGYIEDRFGVRPSVGAFPAISIGISDSVDFKPFDDELKAVGIMRIPSDAIRIMLDGLGRVAGALDLCVDHAGRQLVDSFVFPVTLYAPAPGTPPLSIDEMGQLFSDFNFRVNPVPANMAISLDQSDIYIRLTNALAKEPFIADFGGMELRSKSLGRKSTALVVQSVLLRTVRGASEGRDFQESNLARGKTNLSTQTYQTELNSIADYFTQIQTRMGERWKERDSLHLTAPGWQALGVFHHDLAHTNLNLTDQEKAIVYDKVAGIDWSRENAEWEIEAKLGRMEEGRLVILGAGRNNTQHILNFVRHKAGLSERLLDSALETMAAEIMAGS